MKKYVEVVCAVILDDHKVLATQRGYGTYKDKWEFPGGKIEKGEDCKEALVREIKEELNCLISVDKYLTSIKCDYGDFTLMMHCFLTSLKKGNVVLLEHESMKWLDVNNLDSLDWLEADRQLLKRVKEEI